MLSIVLPPQVHFMLEKAWHLFEKYIFNDWNALAFLMVLFLLDTGLGMARSFRQGRFHSRGMRQMFTKLRDYGVGIVVAHVFCNIEVDGSKFPWAEYMAFGVKGAIYFFILLIETKSIDENLRGLGGLGLPLPKFLRRGMTDWEETGQFRSKTPPDELPAAPEPDPSTEPAEGTIPPAL
ncbi:phage holin family protein [Hymenobacter yonginensis]|uniref:Phage holin family protein n=1 Tax=Hymenobacter yonginensis TaxID=748197 RepID=A0ABY7PTS1_9BACT|nr:phage holin family protein [Hymenobacter yonginensis]WBO86249.1 phage holin family protein [Hymenobacter yonginensis]